MFRFLIIFAVLLTFVGLSAGARAQNKSISLDGQTWRIAAQKAEITEHLGRKAIALTDGRIWADDAQFSDGVISFDVAYKEQIVFIGAGWRAADDSHFEEMYFRGHLNGKPDALQYAPVVNRLSGWQIFSDENSIAPVTQSFTAWNQVKIVVQGDAADIYFNSLTPVLHVPDLKTELKKGAVALRSIDFGSVPTYFSDVVVRPLKAGEAVIGKPKPMPELPTGVIEQWTVSSPFSEDLVINALELEDTATAGLKWQTLAVETNGIGNLAKLAERQKDGNTVFVRMKLRSESRQMKEMRFGYSDRARIYLNGKLIYGGDAGWRVRDYRFLGTVGFFDSIGLDLRPGDNDLMVAVSETFGGWAWAGAIADREGIMVR